MIGRYFRMFCTAAEKTPSLSALAKNNKQSPLSGALPYLFHHSHEKDIKFADLDHELSESAKNNYEQDHYNNAHHLG